MAAVPVLHAQSIGRDSTRVARDSTPADPRFTRISGAALISAPAFTLEQSLQGKVAGMIVSMNSGAPWSDGQIQIRGVSTIVGDPSPLVIVDGVRTTNTLLGDPSGGFLRDTARGRVSTARLRDFTPFEIESVEILKGPIATSLYGSRGAAGVVLITTRRGADGPLKWRAMQRVGAAHGMRLTEPRCFSDVATAQADAPRFFGMNAQAAANANGGQLPCTARVREIFGANGLGVESALSASGSVFGTRVLLSASRLANGGPIDATGASRSNFRLNVDRAVTSRIIARLSSGLAFTDAKRGYRSDEVMPLLAFFPSWLSDSAMQATRVSNPLEWFRDGADDEDSWRSTNSLALDYTAIRRASTTLTVSYLGGVDRLAVNNRVRLFVRDTPPFDLFEDSDANSSIQNQELAVRLRQQLPHFGRLNVSITGTRDRQTMRQDRSTRYGDVEASSGFTDLGLTTSAVQMQTDAMLFGERLQLGASARQEQFGSAANLDGQLYPAVHAAYRVIGGAGAPTLTIRSAWGRSGGLGAIGTASLIAARPDGFFNRTPDNRLTEKRTDTEIGADVRSRSGRLSASATVFRSRHDALWFNGTEVLVSGFNAVLLPDLLAMRTTGAELTIAARLMQSARMQWDARVNVTRSATTLTRPGDSVVFRAGYAKFSDARSHTLIGGEPVTAIASSLGRMNGDAASRFDFSAINSVSRGPLSISLQVDWRSGGQVYSVLQERADRWGNSSDYADPSPVAGTQLGAYRRARASFSDSAGVYVSPAGAVRVRELTVRYALSPRWAARTFASRNVGLSLQTRNLAMWSRSVASDPEFSTLGTSTVTRYVDNGGYPPMRQVFVGLDVGY